jgi:hypothetical protein
MALTQVASGLIASVSGASLTGTQNIPKATLPTGSVLQVVSAVSSTQYSTTSSSLTGTLSLAITPSSTSSKILLNWMIAGGVNGGSNVGAHWALYRNGSSVADYAYVLYNSSGSAGQMLNPVPIIYYDSPATTSAVTYQLYIGAGGTTTVTINNYYYSYLILQEISA